jgi:diketogulonate reductase-like aldo/keto reductase
MEKMFSRRQMIRVLGYGSCSALINPLNTFAFSSPAILKRPIPSSGEMLPAVGLGTWIQFDVGTSYPEREPLIHVLHNMMKYEGKVIDSSPMYGRSEKVIGDLTTGEKIADHFFYATKVWTRGRSEGIEQMETSMARMGRKKIDLMQIHNLVDWQTHLKTLRDWKEKGKIRYIGITHYTDTAHPQLEQIIKSEKPDFVQFNYSARSRHAEQRLLNTAKDNGVAVIINQPFESGELFNLVNRKKLPPWSADHDIKNWAQFFLKYILSHPAVTCVIPGTSDPAHVIENITAGHGRLPDEKVRKKMAEFMDGM